MKHLENKVALVTGGSRGMGAAIVKQLAEAGAKVAFTYVRSAEKARQLAADLSAQTGQSVIALEVDSASDTAVTAAVEEVVSRFGGIDILVNNAGVYYGKRVEEHTAADYDQTMNINVKGVFMACVAAVKHMKAGGRIISIGSNMADRVVGPGASLYTMSKSALVGMTRGMARELGPKGITVNLVQPGHTDTDMNPATSAHADASRHTIALQHYGDVSDIANMVTFLAGPQGRYITGAMLTVDGGVNA